MPGGADFLLCGGLDFLLAADVAGMGGGGGFNCFILQPKRARSSFGLVRKRFGCEGWMFFLFFGGGLVPLVSVGGGGGFSAMDFMVSGEQ